MVFMLRKLRLYCAARASPTLIVQTLIKWTKSNCASCVMISAYPFAALTEPMDNMEIYEMENAEKWLIQNIHGQLL